MKELTELDNGGEAYREYFWLDGYSLKLENITHFAASATTHRLKDSNDLLHIVPEGWRHIIIKAKHFTI